MGKGEGGIQYVCMYCVSVHDKKGLEGCGVAFEGLELNKNCRF